MKLIEYLQAERGRGARVAAIVGVTPAFLSQIAAEGRPVPAERCAAIEAACNHQVRRWDLRPHDWHSIWPELVSAPGAPFVAEAAVGLSLAEQLDALPPAEPKAAAALPGPGVIPAAEPSAWPLATDRRIGMGVEADDRQSIFPPQAA